jgi:hypothetical protein
MCVHKYTEALTHIHKTHRRTCAHACIHIHALARVEICAYIHTYTCTGSCKCVYTRAYTEYTFICTYTDPRMHPTVWHIHQCVQMQTHTRSLNTRPCDAEIGKVAVAPVDHSCHFPVTGSPREYAAVCDIALFCLNPAAEEQVTGSVSHCTMSWGSTPSRTLLLGHHSHSTQGLRHNSQLLLIPTTSLF